MKKFATLLFISFVCLFVKAQSGQLAKYTGVVPGSYNFWLYAPEEYVVDQRKVPLIIFLHGASLCGNNLQKVRRYGMINAVEKGAYYPAMIIAPQNPGGAWNPKKIMALVDWVNEEYGIDTTRIYVIGMSLGGYGTMDLVGTYPERIAAAMAICGGTTLKEMDGLGKVPLWIIHGTADRAVPIAQSKRVVETLQKNGNDHLLRYDWLAGVNHGHPARLFYLKQTYDWLIAHSLADNPRTLDTQIGITVEELSIAYEDITGTGASIELVSRIKSHK